MSINNLKQKLSSPFVQNVGWLGVGELANRIFRLGTTVILARLLSPHDYGLAAIVLTTKEFASVFTLRSGVAGKLIQADQKDVEIFSNTAYWLNWMLCISLFVVQCIAAFPIAWIYRDNQIILPICIVALEYLLLPFFAIQMALINRENRYSVTALASTIQSAIGNFSTIVLALLGMGMWAIVFPVVLSTPVWIIIAYKSHSWRPKKNFTLYRWREVFNFGKNVLGVELLDKLRANLDYLLVGTFLGVDALGVYYFAFNAGLGISLNVINVLTWPLFPYLCSVRSNFNEFKDKYFSSIRTIALVIVPLVILQSSLAPFYVPIVFGQKWIAAIPILIVICLSALPRPFSIAASALLVAVDKTDIDLKWNLIFTVFLAVLLIFAMKSGIFTVAVAVLVSHIVAMPIFTFWATRYVLRPNSPFAK
ncbi:lipopolysaccharide biosynthesis protein [Stenomitos frigidus]|uniref:Lipopolysaccharide biosynthesis protein n=1 Tax=Stenomitos frigidus ULC18 TaxID=2107698 RepID=A0A2T1ED24_9CYAN|nr:lipopolysaccharide biosynthesis protein [Stenomitos frigidus]PSB30598.1 lipopolysaccharide biosynthesis protein [Stenomitos frigidus ULC18]